MNANGYIKSKMFYWIMSSFLTVVLVAFGYLVGRVDKTNDVYNHNLTIVKDDVSEIKIEVAETRKDIEWIKDKLK